MFGSNKKYKIASEFDALVDQNQNDIDQLKTQNPFETAASKAAMLKASQNAQQFYNRSMNTMGANASPEAMVAAQGQASDATAAAAGAIAVGAEANRNQQVNALNALKQQAMGTSANIKINAIDQGWDNFFKGLNFVGQGMEGGAQIASLFI